METDTGGLDHSLLVQSPELLVTILEEGGVTLGVKTELGNKQPVLQAILLPVLASQHLGVGSMPASTIITLLLPAVGRE